MALLVDMASAARRLSPDVFAPWAATRTVFMSSEIRERGDVRAVVATALRYAGFSGLMFEDLGGRDEAAERAYLDGVARSDVYVGILADRYGTMLASGRSPTDEEYREASTLRTIGFLIPAHFSIAVARGLSWWAWIGSGITRGTRRLAGFQCRRGCRLRSLPDR